MAIPFYDNIDLNNNKIINLNPPENDNDVANKKFVDDSISALNIVIDAKILEEKADLKDYVDGEITAVNTTISGVSSSIDTKILNSIVDDLYTSDETKSLSANQGVEIRNLINSIREDIAVVNNYESVEDGAIDTIGTILGFAYRRALVPIFIDEPVLQQLNEFDLSQKIGNIAVIFKISAYIIENAKIHYINTDDMKLIDYDIQQAKLKIEFSQTLLPELEDNTLYLILEYYEDNDFLPEEVEEGGE